MYWQKRFDRENPDKECRRNHQKITTDTTEFKYYEKDDKGKIVTKKMYLDLFLDMFNGKMLSYSITQTPSAIGIMAALNKQ